MKPISHPFQIIYQDAHLLVVNKAPGVLSMQINHKGICLKSLLDDYLSRHGRPCHAHIVHRLDRETSGLLIVALSRPIQQTFINHWHELILDRRYTALVEGQPDPPSGTLTSYLWEDRLYRVHTLPHADPALNTKLAVTHYQTLQIIGNRSLVEFRLETGRKHQIRVHAAALLHTPVVGDNKYGSTTIPTSKNSVPPRLMLHAQSITFVHPMSRRRLSFQTPNPFVNDKL